MLSRYNIAISHKKRTSCLQHHVRQAYRKIAVSYQLEQIIRHGRDIERLLTTNELELCQIRCEVEAQVDVDDSIPADKVDNIRLSEPETVLSLVMD